MTAVKDGRIVVMLDDEVITRPGPRIGWLGGPSGPAIHPETAPPRPMRATATAQPARSIAGRPVADPGGGRLGGGAILLLLTMVVAGRHRSGGVGIGDTVTSLAHRLLGSRWLGVAPGAETIIFDACRGCAASGAAGGAGRDGLPGAPAQPDGRSIRDGTAAGASLGAIAGLHGAGSSVPGPIGAGSSRLARSCSCSVRAAGC
jgi:hypothetical protein